MHSFVRTLFRCSIAALLLLILCVLPVRAALNAVPNAIDFGTQPINGAAQSTIVTLNNNTTRTFSIVSISDSTPEFSLSTPSLPVTLPPGGTLSVNVTFAPDAASNFTGSLGFTTSHGYTVNVPISGSGMDPQSADGPGRLSYPGSLNFNNADADAGTTFMLSNSGSSPLTISSVTFAGPWLGLSGLNLSAVLAPGQSISITAFCPSASATNGTLFVQSDAVNSMVAIPWVNGSSQGSISSGSDADSGVFANPNAASASQNSPSTSVVSPNSSSSATTRSVDLSWSPSSSGSIVGYNVYRSSVSGGPYNTVTSAPVASTAYVDNTVASAQTFYYVVTALASGGQESGFSGEVAVAIP